MQFKAYHKDLNSLHIGCEAPRAYFVPFSSEAVALAGDRNESDRFLGLCGEWDFKYYGSFEDVEEDFLEQSFNETITVPLCWQLLLDRGYDVPLYSNLKYPFQLDHQALIELELLSLPAVVNVDLIQLLTDLRHYTLDAVF